MYVDGTGSEPEKQRKPKTRQEINERVKAARAYFLRKDVKVALQKNLPATADWLKSNHDSIGEDGIMRGRPWADTKIPVTDIPALRRWRVRAMEDSCFENGLRKLTDLMMAEKEIGYPCDLQTVKRAVDFRAMAFHYQLAAFKYAGRGGMTLSYAAKTFDYGQPARLRNAMLAQMVELGLWDTLPAKEDYEAHAISIGTVAWEFHVKVLIPTIEHFSAHAAFK